MPKAGIKLSVCFLVLFLGPVSPALSSEYGLTFTRDNRTYRWNNFLNYSGPVSQSVQVNASGGLSKTLIKSATGSSGSDRWQDSYTVSAGFDYRLRDWTTVGINLTHEQNSVNRGEITTRTGTLSSTIAFQPRPELLLKQYVGGKLDHKKQTSMDSREEGLNYGFNGTWRPPVPHLQTNLKVAMSGDKLTMGHSSSRALMATLKRNLFPGARLSFTFDDHEEGRTNLFGPADEAILKRQDRINRSIDFKAELPLPRDIDFDLSLSSTDRRIEYSLPEGPDEEVSRLNSRKIMRRLSAQMAGRPAEKLIFSTDFFLGAGKNDFGRNINDEDLEEISLSAEMGAVLSSGDSLSLAGLMGRTSYDTPHADNFNDRDSYRSAAKMAYAHTFSPALKFILEATANFSHLVYLRSQRSANNNWGRLYALYPTVHIWPWENMLILQRFSISANYTEYDFEDLFTDIKSNVFRQAKTTTDLNYRLGGELDLKFSYTYRAEDFGRLIKEEGWVEILSWDKSFQNMDFSISYPLISGLVITPNLGYGHRREYEHSGGERIFKSRLISKRIGLSGRYELWPDNDMTFSVSRSVEDASGFSERTFDRLQLNLQHSF